jgi:starvation-inducible outer membrane lipoprotein
LRVIDGGYIVHASSNPAYTYLEMMARPLRPAARLVLRAIAQRSALCFSFAAMELSRRS